MYPEYEVAIEDGLMPVPRIGLPRWMDKNDLSQDFAVSRLENRKKLRRWIVIDHLRRFNGVSHGRLQRPTKAALTHRAIVAAQRCRIQRPQQITHVFIQELLARCTDREQGIIRAIYWNGERNADVAVRLRVTRSRVSQIVASATRKMRRTML